MCKDIRLVYAVIKTGGKQYKVRVGETIEVEKIAAEDGAQIRLDQVLLAANDGDVAIGHPVIDGAVVTARAVRQHKGPKLIVFKYKSKSRYRRRTGHRQHLTQLDIQSIEVPGWAPERAAAPVASMAPTMDEEPGVSATEPAETPAPGAVAEAPALVTSRPNVEASTPAPSLADEPVVEPSVVDDAPEQAGMVGTSGEIEAEPTDESGA